MRGQGARRATRTEQRRIGLSAAGKLTDPARLNQPSKTAINGGDPRSGEDAVHAEVCEDGQCGRFMFFQANISQGLGQCFSNTAPAASPRGERGVFLCLTFKIPLKRGHS